MHAGRKPFALVAAVTAALALAAAASADKEQIHFTAAGQKIAHAAVMRKADLGGAPGWTGATKKPDLSGDTGCPGFNPKQSDLVVIGAAETVWKNTGLQFDSEAQVLKTPAMVRLDWQRTVLAPQVLPCLKENVAKNLPASEKLVSIGRIPVPKLATYSRAYRTIVDVSSGAGSVRVFVDVLLFGKGATEMTLTTTAIYTAAPTVGAAELRLARLLLSRAS
jgi:hypothetical protein